MKANYELTGLVEVAKDLIKSFINYPVWIFKGEMGTGKTTLIKTIGEALGVGNEMSSPTFSIVNEYLGAGGNEIYHFDLYRLKSMNEALDIGIEEYLDSGKYCFIEWPEIIDSLLPEEYVEISIKLVDHNTRDLTAILNGPTI